MSNQTNVMGSQANGGTYQLWDSEIVHKAKIPRSSLDAQSHIPPSPSYEYTNPCKSKARLALHSILLPPQEFYKGVNTLSDMMTEYGLDVSEKN